MRGMGEQARGGFTLIEVTVGLALIATFMAMLFPVVIQQIGRWQAVRVAQDVTGVARALEQFHLDTGQYPRQLTHLANPIALEDRPLDSRYQPLLTYGPRHVEAWNGPYIDRTLATTLTDAQGMETGFDGVVATGLLCISRANRQVTQCRKGTWVVLYVSGLSVGEFEQVNRIVDPGEAAADISTARAEGRLVTGGPLGLEGDPVWTYYLATPYLIR